MLGRAFVTVHGMLMDLWNALAAGEPFRTVLAWPWWKLRELPLGAWLVLGALLLCVLTVGLAAASHALTRMISSKPPQSAEIRTSARKPWGVKALALIVLAILPMGLTAAGLIYLVMGKAHWRRDALALSLSSLLFLAPLAWLASPYFPYAEWQRNEWAWLVLALGFALVQLWALVKLLREYWGEPDDRVPLWPPAAWWLQGILLAGCLTAAFRV